MQEVDIILEGGTILTLDDADTIIPSGAVAIRQDTIVAVGPRSDVAGRYRGRTVIEATNHVIMPGCQDARRQPRCKPGKENPEYRHGEAPCRKSTSSSKAARS